MPKTPRTGAERYFARRMQNPEYRDAYRRARQRIDQIDALVRDLDNLRMQQGLSKAALGRRAGLAPEVVRRLFSSASVNPTLSTVSALATALGADITLTERNGRQRSSHHDSSTVRVRRNSSRRSRARR